MPPPRVQSSVVNGSGVAGDNSKTIIPASPLTVNNRWILGLVAQAVGASAAFSVSDSSGLTWSEQVTHVWATDIVRTSIWSAPINSATRPTVTVTSATDVYGISVCQAEFSGLNVASGAAAVDVTAGHDSGGVPTATPATGTTGLTTGTGELVVCLYGDFGWNLAVADAIGLVDAGNNTPNGNSQLVMSYRTSAGLATQAGSWVVSGGTVNYGAVLAVFKAAAGPPPRHGYPIEDQAVKRSVMH